MHSQVATRVMTAWTSLHPEIDNSRALVGLQIEFVSDALALRQQAAFRAFANRGIANRDDFRTLALLRRLGEKGASVTEIATALGVTAGTVSNRIDRLYREGLFARVPHDRDRRSHLVTLTSQGIELTDELYRAIISVHDDFLKSFNDKQASQLSTLLDLCET